MARAPAIGKVIVMIDLVTWYVQVAVLFAKETKMVSVI